MKNLGQNCDRSYDNLRTNLKIFCKSSPRLQLNPDKFELIWFGSQVNLERLLSTVRVGQTIIEPRDQVRDLGVILDSSLSMRQHIAKVTSTCFFHLRRLRKIGKVPVSYTHLTLPTKRIV